MASALSRRLARILKVRLLSSGPGDPCAPKPPADPCAPKKAIDPCAPKPTVNPCDPCAPKPTVNPCDPCAPKPTADPCAPKPTADPCAPKPTVNPCDPCAPKPTVNPCDPCAPKQAIDPCAPKQAIDPCAPKQAIDPCAPKQAIDPCAPKQAIDPCAPKQAIDPCAPKQAIDPCGPKQTLDPCAQPSTVGPCPPMSAVDPCPPKPPQPPKVTRLPNGLAVASIENYAPVSRVALVANAGSRFETGDNLGVTHCLRLASGLSTQKSTGFKITRTLEQAGAEFTCSSTREYMFYKIDFLRDNLNMVTEILNQVTTSPTFKSWELSDLTPHLKLDLAKIQSQPNVLVYDLLHQAAFRDTLGRSLYAPEFKLGQFSCEELFHYVKSYYSTGRLALVGVGVDHDELVEHAQKFNPFCAASIANDKARYYGGEIRQDTGGDLAYAAVAFEGPSVSDMDLLHAACLQHVMGLGPAIKHSAGTISSPLAQAVSQATCLPFAITSINANYTDSGLFGFYAVAPPKEMAKVLHAAYKQFDKIVQGGVNEKQVARAKKQLKAQIAMYREGADTVLYDLAEQTLGNTDSILSTPDLFKFVDSVNTSDVANVAKKMTGGKPSMAATGNLSQMPYIDNLLM